MLPRVVRRITHREDSYIPFWCEVYVVEYGDTFYLYITSSIHTARLRKAGISYSRCYMATHDITRDSHYIGLITPFK